MSRVISDAVQEGRFIYSKRAEMSAPARSEAEEAEHAEAQAHARDAAATEAAEREARVAAINDDGADATSAGIDDGADATSAGTTSEDS